MNHRTVQNGYGGDSVLYANKKLMKGDSDNE